MTDESVPLVPLQPPSLLLLKRRGEEGQEQQEQPQEERYREPSVISGTAALGRPPVVERRLNLNSVLAEQPIETLNHIAIDAGRLAAHDFSMKARDFWTAVADCARQHIRQKASQDQPSEDKCQRFLVAGEVRNTPDPPFLTFKEAVRDDA